MEEKQENYRFGIKEEAAWRHHLDEEGFVVIKDWVEREECAERV
jgi:hypothetical protein